MSVCPLCKDKGLLPFAKDGRVIPNAWIYCECYEEPREYYSPDRIDGFDFPCSYSFRSYYSETNSGEHLPGLIPKEVAEPVTQEVTQRVVYQHSELTPKNMQRLDRIESDLMSLKRVLSSGNVRRVTTDGSDSVRQDITDRYRKR